MTYKILPQPPVPNEQVQEYVEAAQKGRNSYLVRFSEGRWIVRPASAQRDQKSFASKDEALSYARESGAPIIFPDQESGATN